MPVFKNYDANGNLLNTVTEPLNEKNIDRFILEQGEEKAKMYLEFLAEFTEEIKHISYKNITENGKSPAGLYTVDKKLRQLYKHNVTILKLSETLINSKHLEKPSIL